MLVFQYKGKSKFAMSLTENENINMTCVHCLYPILNEQKEKKRIEHI